MSSVGATCHRQAVLSSPLCPAVSVPRVNTTTPYSCAKHQPSSLRLTVSSSGSLLKNGDTLLDESLQIVYIYMGTMLRQVNDSTHLAFQVVREDGSMALVVGNPV